MHFYDKWVNAVVSYKITQLQTRLLSLVLPGPGSASGASHHGAGATGQRAGYLPSGRHALFARLLPGQERRLNTTQK